MEHLPSTRERILWAAQQVIREKGLARTTVREIATAANLSEGALYKHFASKSDIVLSMLRHAPTDYIQFLAALPMRAGDATLEHNIAEFVARSLEFHERTLPIAVSLFAEPALLAEFQGVLRERQGGPHKAVELLSAYLAAEQRLGRVGATVTTSAVASMLAGACFNQTYIHRFEGKKMNKTDTEKFAADLVTATLKALA